VVYEYTKEPFMDEWQVIAYMLKDKIWDISEEWLRESKNDLLDQDFLSLADEDIISNLPTLMGGIVKAVEDPAYLEDFQSGGHIYSASQELGRERQQNGYQIEKVFADYSLLRKKIWDTIRDNQLSCMDTNNILELEARINTAIDKICESTIQSFYQKSSIELIEIAFKDKLTGFPHLNAFFNTLDTEINRARRYQHPLSLAIIDIDNFTNYNNEHGRFAGNNLLRDIARNIYRLVRTTDRFARLGSDEFAILAPETQLDNARNPSERIRQQVKQETHHRGAMATLSIGMAAYPANADNRDELLAACQKSLVEAQKNGGDNICLCRDGA